jgi:hypothetical protein
MGILYNDQIDFTILTNGIFPLKLWGMNNTLIGYLILSIFGLGFVLMTLPDMIAKKIVERQKREGLYKMKEKRA